MYHLNFKCSHICSTTCATVCSYCNHVCYCVSFELRWLFDFSLTCTWRVSSAMSSACCRLAAFFIDTSKRPFNIFSGWSSISCSTAAAHFLILSCFALKMNECLICCQPSYASYGTYATQCILLRLLCHIRFCIFVILCTYKP